jgi:hypothetical protein
MTKQEDTWDGFEVVKGAEPGDVQKGKVTKVEQMTWREFLKARGRESVIPKFEAKETADKVQCVLTIEGDNGVIREECLNMPEGKQIGAGSKLGKYQKLYGNLPKAGDVVKLQANVDSFWELYLG